LWLKQFIPRDKSKPGGRGKPSLTDTCTPTKKMQFFGALVLIAGLRLSEADLPVHCLLQDVTGEWDFMVGPAQAPAYPDMKDAMPQCGHHIPNQVVSMLEADPNMEVPTDKMETFRIKLTDQIKTSPFRHLNVEGGENSSSKAAGNLGKDGYWTMVFDEGFEVRSQQGRNFFAHFYFESLPDAPKPPSHGDRWGDIGKYYGRVPQVPGSVQGQDLMKTKGNLYSCHCNRLSVGWWHQRGKDGKSESGCFWATKTKNKDAKADAYAKVDDRDSDRDRDRNTTQFLGDRDRDRDRDRDSERDRDRGRGRDRDWDDERHMSLIRWSKAEAQVVEPMAQQALRGAPKASLVNLHSMAGLSAHEQLLMSNANADRIWDISEIPSDAEARPLKGGNKEVLVPTSRDLQSDLDSLQRPKTSLAEVSQLRLNGTGFKGLPANFDWRDIMADMSPAGVDDLSEQFSQGACGSCYAFSGALVLNMRFRIQLFKQHKILYPLELSWKSATKCSPYTEGCEGGFAYLTFKHAAEMGLPLASCDSDSAPKSLDNSCDWGCYRNNPDVFFAKNYGQTGGFAHGSNEESIMREIHANGPVIVSFAANAIPEFISNNGQSYKKGTDILTMIKNNKVPRETSSANPAILPWSYTTHSILAVGWGEESVPGGGAFKVFNFDDWKSTGLPIEEYIKEQKALKEGPPAIVKYWVVRNSWGKGWGTQGYAKIRRGQNDAAIETSAPWVEPDMDRLPEGFLEKAKQYHRDHEESRAKEGHGERGKREKGRGGKPGYCKERPDSPDCQ